MKVQRLIEQLQDAIASGDLTPDSRVHLAIQPERPIECYTTHDLVTHDGIAYIAEGGHVCRLLDGIAEDIGWTEEYLNEKYF